MHDQEVDNAGLEATADSVQAPKIPTPTPPPRFRSLDDAVKKIEAAHFSKVRPTPICWNGSTWLVSGYLRAPAHIKYNLWETEWDLSKGIWMVTENTKTFIYPDLDWQQPTLEGMSNGE